MHKITHHTLGDGVFGNFVHLSGDAACCHAVITPENCVVEMERVIAEARRDNQPAYIAVPSDYALAPVAPADVKSIELRSNEAALQKAMAVIAERTNKAKSVVVLPAFTILRLGLQKELQKAIEALGYPFVTTLMEKCVIDESHPQFAGMYAGAASDPKTRQLVEGADLVLDLGGVNLNDITTAAYSAKLDPSRFIGQTMDKIKPLFTAKATATGGRNGRTEASDGIVAVDLSVPRRWAAPASPERRRPSICLPPGMRRASEAR